ncbi:5-oxoprolinase subunit PxpA [Marivirga aurantiaca]|nr:5-oxoprolinase subunit PxpA [Marivirga aurantiaca]
MDINCDIGESYGYFSVGNDEKVFPYITSCNIACGFHGGDPIHIENTITNALKHKVQIGAHPSYPDLMGFGRRPMQLPLNELRAILKYQISALKGMTESLGGRLVYVKPHGALYNSITNNEEEGIATLEAIQAIDPQLAIMGLPGSKLEHLAHNRGITFVREGFIDRAYLPTGNLMPRNQNGAVVATVEDSVAQAISIIKEKKVKVQGGIIDLEVDSICIHGDNPLAPEILKDIQKAAERNNFNLAKFLV